MEIFSQNIATNYKPLWDFGGIIALISHTKSYYNLMSTENPTPTIEFIVQAPQGTYREIVENLRVDEVEQRPELLKGILDRSSRQK